MCNNPTIKSKRFVTALIRTFLLDKNFTLKITRHSTNVIPESLTKSKLSKVL